MERFVCKDIPISNLGQKVYGFTIDVPNDVSAITGIAIATDAQVWIGVDNAVSRIAMFSELPNNFKDAQAKYNRTNVLEKIRYKQQSTPEVRYGEIAINSYSLGTVNLKSYEASGQFFAESLNPKVFNSSFYGDNFGTPFSFTGKFLVKAFEDKTDIYTPVNVDANTTELHGFFQPSDFGMQILPEISDVQALADTTFVTPYKIKIYLRYKVK